MASGILHLHQLLITDSSKAVVLLWFSVACLWCKSFSDVSPYVCSYYFSLVCVAEWPPARSVDHVFDYL